MMAPQLIYASVILLLAVAIQFKTGEMIVQTHHLRQEILASTERCPRILETDDCTVKIAARRVGQWDPCDESSAPSGANLPMHRWFRVTGQCKIKLSGVLISLPIAPLLVYR
jgi:hypothetical protein